MRHSHWPLLDLRITVGDLELRPLVEADLAEVVRVLPADLELNPHATRFAVTEDVHRAVLPAADVRAACASLLGMTRAERAALPSMHPGRVDVIGAGALIWARIVEHAGVPEVLTSEHDILDGIAWSLVPG